MRWLLQLFFVVSSILSWSTPAESTTPVPAREVLMWWHKRDVQSQMEHVMRISKAGVERIAKHEGLRLRSYKDVAGVWTIGYGHTGKLLNGKPVGPKQTITTDEALALFASDLKWVEDALHPFVARISLQQHEFDALASLVFNTGAGVLGPTRSLGMALRTGNRMAIGAAMLLYKNAMVDGVKQPVLLARRIEERDLFRDGYPTV